MLICSKCNEICTIFIIIRPKYFYDLILLTFKKVTFLDTVETLNQLDPFCVLFYLFISYHISFPYL